MANILAKMGEYGQLLSPSNLQTREETQEKDAPKEVHAEEAEIELLPVHDEKKTKDIRQEQPVPSQTAPEENLEEIRAEEELAQETAEPRKVLTRIGLLKKKIWKLVTFQPAANSQIFFLRS